MASPISIERFVQELEKLRAGIVNGEFKAGEYDQRLARTMRELRERGIDGDRADIIAALDAALQQGTITDSVRAHLQKRFGLE
ncbi:MAG: hypothetical protein IIA55_07225 [Gemmatimonadetes bacterium]|nr:hypothetical protein [Gemmatimonadota bacterium]MCH7777862.1 hypothetical protein [Gemmatimonadota bacterium]MCH8144492.1 hypothetical protein [Gemmatimonadota bacterium]MCH8936039.1 hypothetical protein [Gemmatimonadota bacterium]MCH8938390.1 hypothetical protein [Gemmatimonadota bacterium]